MQTVYFKTMDTYNYNFRFDFVISGHPVTENQVRTPFKFENCYKEITIIKLIIEHVMLCGWFHSSVKTIYIVHIYTHRHGTCFSLVE